MKWQSFSRSFDLTTPQPHQFIDELLLSVVQAFQNHFVGHAKCRVKTKGLSYFASTTGIPPVVEWKPNPIAQPSTINVEAVWIFMAECGPIPDAQTVDDIVATCKRKFSI